MECEFFLKHAQQIHQGNESVAAEENYCSLPRPCRPHHCEDCSKRFTKLSDLKRHVQTHTGERPHTCEECSKSFLKSSDLKRHVLTHSGRKPFECSKCLKCFTKSSYLQKHMEKHYIEEPFKCGDCMLRFVSLADLGRHMETHLFELVQFARPPCDDAIETAKLSTSMQVDIKSEVSEDAPSRIDSAADVIFGDRLCSDDQDPVDEMEQTSSTVEFPLKSTTSYNEILEDNINMPLVAVKMEPDEIVDNDSEPYFASCGVDDRDRLHWAKNARGFYCCEICDKKFRHERSLNKHRLLSCRLEAVSVQETIRRGRKKKTQLKTDEMVHSKRFQCNQCSKGFSKAHDLKRHLRSHTGEKPYGCSQCSKRFTRSSDLKAHVRGHAGIKPYMCDRCFMGFAKSSSLKMHVLTHSADRPYRCDRCFKGFRTMSSLRVHLRSHSVENSDSLTDRETGFRSSEEHSELDLHQLGISPTSGTDAEPNSRFEFRCDACPAVFVSVGTLNRHRKLSHCVEEPYVCHECCKTYTRPHDLRRHVMRHTGEAPFRCDECSRCFTRSCYLTRHARTHHSQARPHLCDLCAMRFASKSDLTRHKRSHSGEKPFVCDECAKRFTRLHDLTRHSRLHSGEKLFECDVCSRGFTRSGYLTKHMLTHRVELTI